MADQRSDPPDAEQLARVFGWAPETPSGEPPADPHEDRAQILQDWLHESPPMPRETVDLQTPIARRLCRGSSPDEGKSVLALLLDPGGDIQVIRRIKQRYKSLATRRRSPGQHAAAVAIYYAAIATALRFCDQKITRYAYEDLDAAFGKPTRRTWMDPVLAEHLASAQELCRAKASQRGE